MRNKFCASHPQINILSENLIRVPFVAHFPLGRITVWLYLKLDFELVKRVFKGLWKARKAIALWPVLSNLSK